MKYYFGFLFVFLVRGLHRITAYLARQMPWWHLGSIDSG